MLADVLGGEKIAVTYCGLTNSAIVYRVGEQSFPELSVISAPANNILYWDARSRSLVQQLVPQMVYGRGAGQPLRTLPVVYTTWKRWRTLVPGTTFADPPFSSLPDHAVSRLMRIVHMRTRATDAPLFAIRGGLDRTVPPKSQVFAL